MKFFCKKTFAVRKILEPKKTRGLKNFGSNKIGRKKFWVKKNFGKKIFGQKEFSGQNFFCQNIYLSPRNLWLQNIFLFQKNFWVKKILDKKENRVIFNPKGLTRGGGKTSRMFPSCIFWFDGSCSCCYRAKTESTPSPWNRSLTKASLISN